MKALVYDAKTSIELKEIPIPRPKCDEVLIKVTYAGICGSDMVAWRGGFTRIKSPVVLGHEMIGTVVEPGINVPENLFKAGERVVAEPIRSCGHCDFCRKGHYNCCSSMKVIGLDLDGGFAEYCAVPYSRLHKIPEGIQDLTAILCEPFAVASHMVARTGLVFGDTALITGAGPIGLTVACVAKEAGARVIITEINPKRIEIARGFGFEVIDPGNNEDAKSLEGFAADAAFELSGAPSSMDFIIKHIKRGGCVLVGAFFKKPLETDMHTVTLHELKLIGSRMYCTGDYQKSMALLQKESFGGRKMISHVIALKDIVEKGFAPIANGDPVVKIIVKINEVRMIMGKVKVVCMVKKLESLTLDEFSAYWKTTHADMDLQYKYLRGYCININYPEYNDNPPYDGSCEMYWDSYEEMQADFSSELGQRAGTDGANFIADSITLITHEDRMK